MLDYARGCAIHVVQRITLLEILEMNLRRVPAETQRQFNRLGIELRRARDFWPSILAVGLLAVTKEHVERQSIQNKRNLEADDNEFRDFLRRTAADPALTRDYLLRVSMIGSLRRAEQLG